MNATDIIWAAAGEREQVPGGMDDLPGVAEALVRAWLARGLTACGHDGVLFAAYPERFAVCVPCALKAHMEALALICGECREPVRYESLSAVYALGDDIIALVSLCSKCAHETKEMP